MNIVDDTRLMAYVYDESLSSDLESLLVKFGIDKPYKIGSGVKDLEGEALAQRNCRDTVGTRKLRDILADLLSPEETKIYREVMLPAAKALANIELQGMRVDPDKIDETIAMIEGWRDDLALEDDPALQQLKEITGKEFKIKSTPQRLILVYDILGYKELTHPSCRTTKGGPSTKADVLKKLMKVRECDTLDKMIKFSEYTGWIQNFLNVMHSYKEEVDGLWYIFSSLWLGESVTGRLISNNPNMQNAPSKGDGVIVRQVVIPKHDEGCFVEFDYDQLELRILAGLSQDTALIESFQGDPHLETAKVIFNKEEVTKLERDRGKRINFSIPTGASTGRIVSETGLSYKVIDAMLKNYWRSHPHLKVYFDNLPSTGTIRSPTGMKRTVTGDRAGNQIRNMPIQNSALVIHLMGLIALVDDPLLQELGAHVILPCHDSVLLDLEDRQNVEEVYYRVKEILEAQTFDWLPVKLTVTGKIGLDWGHMEEVEE